jgi:hypothetical protein
MSVKHENLRVQAFKRGISSLGEVRIALNIPHFEGHLPAKFTIATGRTLDATSCNQTALEGTICGAPRGDPASYSATS